MELFMEQFVGLDVSQKLTHVCVVDQKGSIVWRGTCLSTPDDIAATVRARAPHAERIGLETGPLSTWHWHALKAMGLPVICIDARHAKAALSMQINKTDRNDAAGLAQIMRTGWYREVGVKSLDNHPAILIMPTNLSDIPLLQLANPLCEGGFHGFVRSYSGRIRPKLRNKTPK